MSDNQQPPWTFRINPDLEPVALDALARLRWSKTQLVNEALRIAIPMIMDAQIKNLTKTAAVEAAVDVAKSRKRVPNPRP